MTTPLNPPPQRFTQDPGFWVSLLTFARHAFARLRQVDISPAKITAGEGAPEGVQIGNVGDMFIRTDGGAGAVLYVKESGTGDTGWVGK